MIAIIGGSGFVGTRLSRRLHAAGTPFRIIDKSDSAAFPNHCRLADVRDLEALNSAVPPNTDVIINLAAEHRDDVRPRSLYLDVNVTGARNVIEVARRHAVKKLVFTSTVACYGFAPPKTGEGGAIAPFNEYGRTKFKAEQLYDEWQKEGADHSLVIVRPTVIFGEQNRGNVYNLLRQIVSGRFVMVGSGENRKSMAYVENVAAFLEHACTLNGRHLYNYVDEPDFDMNTLVQTVKGVLGKSQRVGLRIPFGVGLLIGYGFDALAFLTGRSLVISSIRIKKFAATTSFSSRVRGAGFVAPVDLRTAIERTVTHEFLATPTNEPLFFSE